MSGQMALCALRQWAFVKRVDHSTYCSIREVLLEKRCRTRELEMWRRKTRERFAGAEIGHDNAEMAVLVMTTA